MTGQHIFSGYVKNEDLWARAILRVPNVQKWCNESSAKLTSTPFQLHVDETPGVVFQEKPAAEVENAPGKARTARRAYTRPQDFTQFGFSSGYPKKRA